LKLKNFGNKNIVDSSANIVNPQAPYPDGVATNISDNVMKYYKALYTLSKQNSNWLKNNFGYGGAGLNPIQKFKQLEIAKSEGKTSSPISNYGNPLIDMKWGVVDHPDAGELLLLTLSFLREVQTFVENEDGPVILDTFRVNDSFLASLLLPCKADWGMFLYDITMDKGSPICLGNEETIEFPTIFEVELFAIKNKFPGDLLALISN
jgi:hypothetical protein